MNKYDNFFESNPSTDLNKKILIAAKTELDLLKKKNYKRRVWIYLAPALTFCATLIVILTFYKNTDYFSVESIPDTLIAGISQSEQTELLVNLLEDEETLDIVDDLSLLDEFENLADVTEDELEG